MRHWIVAAALLLTPSAASAGSDQSCLAEAMYFEARDQGWRGMLAVGVVVQNRVKDRRWPQTICGVVRQGRYDKRGNPLRGRCQFSYHCDGISEKAHEKKAWNEALDLSALILSKTVHIVGLEDATHYHATSIRPSWSSVLLFRRIIGQHAFYAE